MLIIYGRRVNMEITVALALSILGSVISVTTFVLNRKDKAVKDAKETNMGLIEYRLNELDGKVQRILDKLDNYDNEIRKIAQEELQRHILEYHR